MKPIRLYFISILIPFIPETRGFSFKRLLYRWAGVEISENVRICSSASFLGNGRLRIGAGSWIGHNCCVISSSFIDIGSNVDIAPQVYIGTGTHVIDTASLNIAGKGISKDVKIGNGCWIGVGSIILPGVTIGEKCITAAGSVVNNSFSDYNLIAGIPAVIKKKLS